MRNSALAWLLMSTLVVVGLWDGWRELKAQGADLLPIRYVRIEGVFQYITKDEVKQAVLKQVMNGFLNADVQVIRQSLLSLPWIAQVNVKRIWPDAIEIRVYEQYPVARWGQIGLLNAQGDLFIPPNLAKFNQLPLLNGPLGQEKKLVEWMKQLQTALAKQSLAFTELTINDRRAWTVILSNQIELKLGRKDPLEKLQHFLPTVPILGAERIAAITAVDLRYPNGYAVTWKAGSKPTEWQSRTVNSSIEAR
jgi:cell division protein FtsQ